MELPAALAAIPGGSGSKQVREVLQRASASLAAMVPAAARGGVSSVCGRTFRAGDSIYKCRDCGHDNTCVVCADCFHNGDHEGHDYKIIRSGGGCCDCGDPEVREPRAPRRGQCGHPTSPSPSPSPIMSAASIAQAQAMAFG